MIKKTIGQGKNNNKRIIMENNMHNIYKYSGKNLELVANTTTISIKDLS
jgi:hypothetical protein